MVRAFWSIPAALLLRSVGAADFSSSLIEHRSWLDAFEIDVTNELLPNRVNTLAVHLFHDSEPVERGRARQG